LSKDGIGAYQYSSLGKSLRDQQAIERILVQQGQTIQGQNVIKRNRDNLNAVGLLLRQDTG
jgi:hypothetical protein